MQNEQFLPRPHCPESAVSLCAVGEKYTEICKALYKLGVRVLKVPNNLNLSQPVQGHADLQIGMLTGEQVLVGKGEGALKKLLEAEDFIVYETENALGQTYPQEALLDFVSLENQIIGNKKIIRNNNLLRNSQFIHVNQGYTKCNIAVINSHALITSDPAITSACRMAGFDVLQIQSGHVKLPGYSYGFIGGCCGLISANRLAVSGELKTHPDHESIVQFLSKYKVTAIELCKGPLQDIGGIIPLKQRC